MEFLENRPFSEIKAPRKSPEKWIFQSFAFYNAPSLHSAVGSRPAPYRGLLCPRGPERPKKSRKCLEGPPGPGTPKKAQKSLGTIRKVSESLFGVFREFFETFWGSRARRPRERFSRTFSAFRAPRARETSVRGGLVPNSADESPWSTMISLDLFGAEEPKSLVDA